jgi:hypothetical protein
MLDSANNFIPFPNKPFIFQEDKATVHMARVVKVWLASQNIQRLLCLAQSPDMSLIVFMEQNEIGAAQFSTTEHTLLRVLRGQVHRH